MNIYDKILNTENPLLAVLIDPEKAENIYLSKVLKACNEQKVDLLFVGGSLVSKSTDDLVVFLKQKTNIPVILFPGSVIQVSLHADGILFLSLISGRNAEYLISQHVLVAKMLKMSNLEVIPTGYILIGENNSSTTEYITNTRAIPTNKIDVIISTAIAGQLLGMKAIYLEAGSGAKENVTENIIKKVRSEIEIPIIVGGGIDTPEKAKLLANAGANVIVVGNAFERNTELIDTFSQILKNNQWK